VCSDKPPGSSMCVRWRRWLIKNCPRARVPSRARTSKTSQTSQTSYMPVALTLPRFALYPPLRSAPGWIYGLVAWTDDEWPSRCAYQP